MRSGSPVKDAQRTTPSKACSPASFHDEGLTIAQWARERGFSKSLVYSVLRGERKALRGASYQIAKELGMK